MPSGHWRTITTKWYGIEVEGRVHTRPLEEKKEKIVTGPGELVAAPLGKRGGPDLPVVILIIRNRIWRESS